MTQLFKQLKWQFLILLRNNLATMIVAITAFYVLVIYMIRSLPGVEKLVTLLIYNDPAIVGFVFVGVSILLEKDQEVLPALFVTPINSHYFLISRILSLSAIGYLGALAIVVTAKGTAFNFVHFSAGAFSTCVLFTLMGIFLVSYTTEILHFLLRGIPFLIFMSLPLLNYFELTDLAFLKLFPVHGGLTLMFNSYLDSPHLSELVFGYISIAVWTPVLYWFVHRVFTSRMIGA